MKATLTLAAAALAFSAPAVASTDLSSAWSKKDMKNAVRALGYPKPRPKKLGCRTAGDGFRCTATYRHHRRSRFYIQAQGAGGWLCAGKTLAGCKLLRRGFSPADSGLAPQGVAEFAAVGYIQNHYDVTSPSRNGPCTQTGALAWRCGYWATDTTTVNVTITLKAAEGGYIVSGSAS